MTLDVETGERFASDELDDEIRRWLDQEGISSKRITEDDEADFHYTIQYPATSGDANIHVVRPPGRPVLALMLGVQLSPNHKQPFQNLPQDEKRALVHKIRRCAFEGGDIGFAPQMEEDVLARWQLDVSVYDDGLSQDRFFQSLRVLYTKHLELIEVLNEHLGPEAPSDPEQESSTTGDHIRGYI
jgi:hypothetical protein